MQRQHRSRGADVYRIGLAFLAITLINCGIVSANPSSKSPTEPMAIVGIVDGAKEEADRLYKFYDEQAKRIVAADKRKSNPSSIPGSYLAKMHSEAWKAARDANRLAWMGEPAGEDLRIRFEMIQYETNRLCLIYRQSAEGKEQSQEAAQILQAQQSKIDQIWKYIDSIESTDKLTEFQDQMESKGMQLRQHLAYLASDEQERIWPPFQSALERVDKALNLALQAKYDSDRRRAIEKEMRLAKEFAKESERVRTSISTNGKATLVPGVEADAAETFAYLGNLWANAAAGLNRAIALNWAFTNHQRVVVEPTPTQFHFEVVSELKLLIDATASSTPVESVPQLYGELLKQITHLDRRCDPRVRLIEQLRPSMIRLANRDWKFPSKISAYGVATMQPLRWQRRFTEQQRAHVSKDFSSTRQLLYSKQASNPAERQLFAPAQRGPLVAAPNSMVAPASVLVQETSPIAIGASVFGGSLIRLTPNSRNSIVPVNGHAYMNSPVPKPTDSQLAMLRRMLLVTPSHPAITMEAASAISSAEDLDYLNVGGIVEDVHLESLLTRFITMPDVASILIPLGDSARLTTIAFPRQQLCWRLTIKPKWAHNEYFMVQPDPLND